MEYCMDCGAKLRGRTDKKFCNDYCRVHYHNAQNKNKNFVRSEINSILRKNAGILERLAENGFGKLTLAMLTAAEFDFNFFTHQQVGSNGCLYNCCYNIGYTIIDDHEIIIRKDEL